MKSKAGYLASTRRTVSRAAEAALARLAEDGEEQKPCRNRFQGIVKSGKKLYIENQKKKAQLIP